METPAGYPGWFMEIITALWGQLETVLRYPLISSQRIYVVYLFSALIFALFVFIRARKLRNGEPATKPADFFRFLFPSSVWKESSAWPGCRRLEVPCIFPVNRDFQVRLVCR